MAAHHVTLGDGSAAAARGVANDPSDSTNDPDLLAAWTEFHRQVEALPAEERETFDLLFYQGLTHADAAAVLDVSERTIQRRWVAARLRLSQALDGELPGI